MIDFVYSSVYDELFTVMKKKKYSGKQYVDMERFTASLQSFWEKEGKKIKGEIEKISGLKFTYKVRCFTVKDMDFNAISFPFTLKYNKNPDVIRGILIHELIHVLLKDNKKVLELIRKKFGYEDYDFKVHFPVLLIQRRVTENLYGKEYFKKVLQQERDIDELGYEWDRVNQYYPKFEKGIVGFLQNVINFSGIV